MYMYVYIYLCIYIYVYIYTYIHMCVHMYMHMYSIHRGQRAHVPVRCLCRRQWVRALHEWNHVTQMNGSCRTASNPETSAYTPWTACAEIFTTSPHHYLRRSSSNFKGMWRDSSTCVIWLVLMCDMTRPRVFHDSSTCVSYIFHTCDTTHPHVWHESFTRVTWLTCVTRLIKTCDTIIHVCGMTHVYLCHTSCCTCLILIGHLGQKEPCKWWLFGGMRPATNGILCICVIRHVAHTHAQRLHVWHDTHEIAWKA